MKSWIVILVVMAAVALPAAHAHSLFNSAEQTIGDHRVQIATLPEFPQVGEDSTILLRITDRDYNEIDRFTMGMRIFLNDEQIRAYNPESIEGSHWEGRFVFETAGNHIVKVDLYDQDVTTYTFNMSTQSPFGYIFFISIIVGAAIFSIIIAYIYAPRVFRPRH